MIRLRTALLLVSLLMALVAGLLFLLPTSSAACVDSTEPLESMPWVTVTLGGPAGERSLPLRLAARVSQRSAGMQHLCPGSVAANPMLFVFERALVPSFHMRNVHAELDIAFITPDWTVLEVHRMVPGPDLTTPSGPVLAAIEVAAGQARPLGLAPGTPVRLPGMTP